MPAYFMSKQTSTPRGMRCNQPLPASSSKTVEASTSLGPASKRLRLRGKRAGAELLTNFRLVNDKSTLRPLTLLLAPLASPRLSVPIAYRLIELLITPRLMEREPSRRHFLWFTLDSRPPPDTVLWKLPEFFNNTWVDGRSFLGGRKNRGTVESERKFEGLKFWRSKAFRIFLATSGGPWET